MGGGGSAKGAAPAASSQSSGKGSSGKGGESKGLFDWVLNPVGSAATDVFGLDMEIDPFSSAAANIVTNTWDKAAGREVDRPWLGEITGGWVGDPNTAQNRQQQTLATQNREQERRGFMDKYSPSSDSLLADEED